MSLNTLSNVSGVGVGVRVGIAIATTITSGRVLICDGKTFSARAFEDICKPQQITTKTIRIVFMFIFNPLLQA